KRRTCESAAVVSQVLVSAQRECHLNADDNGDWFATACRRPKLPLREGLACRSIKARLERLHHADVTDRATAIDDAPKKYTAVNLRSHRIGSVVRLDISGEHWQLHVTVTRSSDIVGKGNQWLRDALHDEFAGVPHDYGIAQGARSSRDRRQTHH